LKSKSGIQILVVEDEPIIGMLIEDMLIEIGCKNIEAVVSIDSALKFLADARPDFAILDVNLNGAQSYPVAALLKSRKIPFVFVSGYDAAALDAAYADVQILQKPFRIGDLDSAIDAALALGPASITPDRGRIE
jgi:two-component SAPR family response regulator